MTPTSPAPPDAPPDAPRDAPPAAGPRPGAAFGPRGVGHRPTWHTGAAAGPSFPVVSWREHRKRRRRAQKDQHRALPRLRRVVSWWKRRALFTAATALLALPMACAVAVALIGGTAPPPAPNAGLGPAAVEGIPTRVLRAYVAAGGRCAGLDWTLLAAVGAVETQHGTTRGAVTEEGQGQVLPWILGPELNGTGGFAAIPVGRFAGQWGLDGAWARALGPMQFLPATFARYATDGDGDGATSPHDIDDATATTANYLCTAGGGTIEGTAEIARIYNPGSSLYPRQLDRQHARILEAAEAAETAAPGSPHRVILCPVGGDVTFTDTFGAPRDGGARRHQGVDMFAATGTPVVAPEAGVVEHFNDPTGGLSYRLTAPDGTYYYGTHLSGFEYQGDVDAGTILGYVGQTGNAASTPPHLHWEIHPDGRGTPAVNPTPLADAACT